MGLVGNLNQILHVECAFSLRLSQLDGSGRGNPDEGHNRRLRFLSYEGLNRTQIPSLQEGGIIE